MTKKLLNQRQARWSEFSTRFDYEIVYRPGKMNGKADALTRRPGDLPERGDERLNDMEKVVLKPQNLPKQLRLLADSPPAQGCPSITDLMTEAYKTDPLPGKILEAIRTKNGLQQITIADCIADGGRIRYRGIESIPESNELRVHILQKHHDTALAGHLRQAKMFDLHDCGYYCKGMRKDVDRYVWNCHDCKRSRSSRHWTLGVFQLLSLPDIPWEDIPMDFVVILPQCKRFDALWVVADRLSKVRRFIPCHPTRDALGLAVLFLPEVVGLNGRPLTVVSDWGPQFESIFWQQVCRWWGLIEGSWQRFIHRQTDRWNEWMLVWNSTSRCLWTICMMIGSSGFRRLSLLQITEGPRPQSVDRFMRLRVRTPRCRL